MIFKQFWYPFGSLLNPFGALRLSFGALRLLFGPLGPQVGKMTPLGQIGGELVSNWWQIMANKVQIRRKLMKLVANEWQAREISCKLMKLWDIFEHNKKQNSTGRSMFGPQKRCLYGKKNNFWTRRKDFYMGKCFWTRKKGFRASETSKRYRSKS